MSEEFEEVIVTENTPANPDAFKRRVVRSSMFGIPEYIALGIGLLSLLSVFFLYFFYVSPAKAELAQHKDVSRKLSTEVDDAKKKFGNISSTKDRVSELLNSVDFFERNYLPVASIGKTSLYQRINSLISAFGLVNTAGPDFAPLEISTVKQIQQNEKEKGRGKFQSLFPGVYVSVTVNGTYQNLRRFIREIETSGQFVIVSTVELEAAEGQGETIKPANSETAVGSSQRFPRPESSGIPRAVNPAASEFDQKNFNPDNLDPNIPKVNPAQKAGPNQRTVIVKGKTKGDVVSLHLEMAAYFRRNIRAETQQAAAADSGQGR